MTTREPFPTLTRLYHRYEKLSRMATDRARARIVAADPRLSLAMALHCGHNWGNAAAKAEIVAEQIATSRILARRDREYNREYRRLFPRGEAK